MSRTSIAICAALALAACSRGERLEISDVTVDDAPEFLGDVLGAARRALEGAEEFKLREAGGKPGKGAWQCRVRADAGRRARSGGDRLEVTVLVELSRSGAEREKLRGEGRRSIALMDEAGRGPALNAALSEALDRVLAAHAAGKRADDQLIADLESAEGKVRDAAVQALAARKNAAAVPALIAGLDHEDGEAALSTVGALVEIGDRRAVLPIIYMARGRDPELVVQLCYAVAELGGPEAEAWLFTQSQGAEDPRVRGAAQEASKEMARRATTQGRAAR